MKEESSELTPVGDNPEAVIAGTLCLMSFYGQTRCPHAADKIAHNLRVLVEHPAISAPFRDICENLLQHWHRTCAALCRPGPDAPRPVLH